MKTVQSENPEDFWDVLSPLLTENRRNRLLAAVTKRTEQIRLILQDVHNPHNVSACLRSAEAFGIQNVDVVTLNEPFRASTTAKGVHHWINIKNWQTVDECAQAIKSAGFLIAAGMPTQESVSLHELSIDKPIAILFGNEHAGVSPEWQPHIDIYFTIPMAGLVESMNISVCAAITMHHLTYRLNSLNHPNRFLAQEKQNILLGHWLRKSLSRADEIYSEIKSKSGANT